MINDNCGNCLPIYTNGHESENGRRYADDGHKLAELAVEVTEGPVRVQHVSEVEGDV